MSLLRRALDLGIGRIRPAKPDIVARAGREHRGVLRHQRDTAAHVARIGVPDRNAVEGDRSARRIVEAQQQMEQRALAGAGRTDDRDLLTGPDRE